MEIEITKAELEEKFFKGDDANNGPREGTQLTGGTVRLTVIDTPGFGDYVNNRDSWMPIIEFLDDQHESYMLQEQQPRRGDKIDLRVHACLYFIRPTGHTLKPLDIEVMKRLSSRVNLIPVVAKADTLSPADLARFKHRVCRRALPCKEWVCACGCANLSCRFGLSSRRKELRSTNHRLKKTTKLQPSTHGA